MGSAFTVSDGSDVQQEREPTGMRNINKAFMIACRTNIKVIVEDDHCNQGTLKPGRPYRKTLSIATHFINNHSESVSSETSLK